MDALFFVGPEDFKVQKSLLTFWGLGFRVQISGFRFHGLGYKGLGQCFVLRSTCIFMGLYNPHGSCWVFGRLLRG